MCLRVYAVTRRNKLICGVLSALIAAQLSFGIYFAVVDGTGPSEFLNHLPVRVLSHRSLVQKFPEISLDMFHVCVPQERRHVELAFISISVAFGTPLPSDPQRDVTSGALIFFPSHAMASQIFLRS